MKVVGVDTEAIMYKMLILIILFQMSQPSASMSILNLIIASFILILLRHPNLLMNITHSALVSILILNRKNHTLKKVFDVLCSILLLKQQL